MSEDVIKVEGLTKIFNHSLKAVDHISFSVKQGEIFGFLGPNGAGKTTTINMLITILKPTEGKATILGSDIANESNEVRSVDRATVESKIGGCSVEYLSGRIVIKIRRQLARLLPGNRLRAVMKS